MSSSDVTSVTLQLLKTITEDFSKENKIGSGGYGQVYKGVLNGGKIAVKKLFPVNGLDDEAFENEFANLMKVQHKNIIRLVGYCYEIAHQHTEQNGKLVLAQVIDRALCFEYMERGSLSQHISAESSIHDWRTTYRIIKEICEGLHYLHKGRGKKSYIYHLDLKPDNILLDQNLVPKIGDFGLSRLFGDSKTHKTSIERGTRGFMPPEFIQSGTVTPKNDVFGLGVIIFYMIAGKERYNDYWVPYPGPEFIRKKRQEFIESVQEYWKEKMQATVGYIWDETGLLEVKKCIEIAITCVDTDRAKRPTTKEIMDNLIGESLSVVIVHAFDCTTATPNWHKVGHQIFWLVQEKLTRFAGSSLGYTYVMLTPNTYRSDMKLVNSMEVKANGYTASSDWREAACTKNMTSGLYEAHKLISEHGLHNGIILFFSDGLIHKDDFFDGAEDFPSKVPVHTFTLGVDEYNKGLRTIAAKSPGGTFSPVPVPEMPFLSVPFLQRMNNILRIGTTTVYDEKPPIPGLDPNTLRPERWPLDVVIVYAFDSTTSTPAWDKVDKEVFWLVQEKLTHFEDSALGYTYVKCTPNECISDMKLARNHLDTNSSGGYTVSSASSSTACTKKMGSGLSEAHKLMSYRENPNGIILLFSDGLINNGDFFDGAEDFQSEFPVHTFTVGGGAYNHVLRAMAEKSPGGRFHPIPVPDKPGLSAPFLELLDSLLVPNPQFRMKHARAS